MSRNNNPVPQFFDSSGSPLPYGLMYYFESGTNTAKTTYADPNHAVENSHPVQLTGDGRLPNVWFDGSAKQVLGFYDGVGTPPVDLVDVTQIWERDPVTSTEASSFGANWDAVTIYSKNEVVTFNELLYVSLDNNNQNNNPASDATAWTQFDLLKRWNTNETYQVRDPVIATDFTIYMSTIANNLGIDPTTDGGVNWVPSGAGSGATFAFTDWDASTDYGDGGANLVTSTVDGFYYASIQTPNLNNEPSVSPAFWLRIDHIKGGGIDISGDVISSTATDGNINLNPDGTGEVHINGSKVGLADDITTNATNIGTNATDIGTNATDIGTNVTDIASNTTAIALAGSGALVHATVDQTLADGTEVTLTFNTEDYDDNSFWNGSTRMTVPTGVTRVEVFGTLTLDGAASGVYSITIEKNNSEGYSGMAGNRASFEGSLGNAITVHSGPIPVTAGDFFDLKARQFSGFSLDTNVAVRQSSFGIKVIK